MLALLAMNPVMFAVVLWSHGHKSHWLSGQGVERGWGGEGGGEGYPQVELLKVGA